MHASLDTAIHKSSSAFQLPVPRAASRWEGLAEAAVMVRAERDAEIVAQGDPAEHCFLVTSGWLRTVTMMEDGRRQVGDFLTEGDLFGWDVVGEFDMSAEAVTPVTLGRISKRNLELLAERDAGFARRLRLTGAEQLRQSRERIVRLGRMTALERVTSFLAEMDSRGRAGGSDVIVLPMSRVDIADHLGLTVETVCRVLARLCQMRALSLQRHAFRILDRNMFDAIRDCTFH